MREGAKRVRNGGRIAATKGAVEAMTHVLAKELGPRGVTVNARFSIKSQRGVSGRPCLSITAISALLGSRAALAWNRQSRPCVCSGRGAGRKGRAKRRSRHAKTSNNSCANTGGRCVAFSRRGARAKRCRTFERYGRRCNGFADDDGPRFRSGAHLAARNQQLGNREFVGGNCRHRWCGTERQPADRCRNPGGRLQDRREDQQHL
jgi:hypothetical protein